MGKALIYFLFVLFSLTACTEVQKNEPINSTENELFAETAVNLAQILPQQPTIEQVETQLRQWGRIDDGEYWGNVLFADILPTGDDELIITYHKDLSEVIWNPQGMMAILQRQNNTWHVLFESPIPTETVNNPNSLAGNWAFHIAANGDLTGNGYDDLVITQKYSNGTHAFFGHSKLFTAATTNPAQIEIHYLQDITYAQPLQHRISNGELWADYGPIQRWYSWDDAQGAIDLERELIDEDRARFSAQTNDGAEWFVFTENVGRLNEQEYALYRLDQNALTRFAVPFNITYLGGLADGYVYVGGMSQIMRVEDDTLVDVLAQFAPNNELSGTPLNLAFAQDGSLWVAAAYKLWHLGKEQSVIYDLLAQNVMIAPDDSVWVVAWNGRNHEDNWCCFAHIADGIIQRYWESEPLPVPTEIEAKIRAMRPN